MLGARLCLPRLACAEANVMCLFLTETLRTGCVPRQEGGGG